MTKSNKIFALLGGVVICSLLFAAGCAQPVAETPKPDAGLQPPETVEKQIIPVEPEEPAPQIAEKEIVPPLPVTVEPATLVLKFTEGDSTTYRIIAESEKTISFEGPVPDEEHFKGGRTYNRVEMIFDQKIRNVKDNGNTIAEIKIKQLNQIIQLKNNIVLDFDSTRKTQRDLSNPLSKIIDKSYTIEITPDARVTKIVEANDIRAEFEGSSPANKFAMKLFEPRAIQARHEISTLSALDKSERKIGDKWSSEDTLSFGLMGTKSYEKIYTLQEITETNGHKLAVINMNAIPASKPDDEPTNRFTESFDNTEKYTGLLKLDLNDGKVKKFVEKVQLKWITVEQIDEQNQDKEPIVLKMENVLYRDLEKID